jgi:hypothetical protein
MKCIFMFAEEDVQIRIVPNFPCNLALERVKCEMTLSYG